MEIQTNKPENKQTNSNYNNNKICDNLVFPKRCKVTQAKIFPEILLTKGNF